MSAGGQTPAPEDLRSRSADHQCPPPCSKSIRHLQDASGTDGKVAVNLDKLKLFWPYYVMNDRFWIPGKPFQSQQNRQWAGAIVTPSISDVPPPPRTLRQPSAQPLSGGVWGGGGALCLLCSAPGAPVPGAHSEEDGPFFPLGVGSLPPPRDHPPLASGQ